MSRSEESREWDLQNRLDWVWLKALARLSTPSTTGPEKPPEVVPDSKPDPPKMPPFVDVPPEKVVIETPPPPSKEPVPGPSGDDPGHDEPVKKESNSPSIAPIGRGENSTESAQITRFVADKIPVLVSRLSHSRSFHRLMPVRDVTGESSIDIQATVKMLAAASGVLIPQMETPRRRTGHLLVLMSSGVAMQPYVGTVKELIKVAQESGAFHTVVPDPVFIPVISGSESFPNLSRHIRPGRDNLILLIHDGLGETIQGEVGSWIRRKVCSIVPDAKICWLHPWPREDWSSTGFADLPPARLLNPASQNRLTVPVLPIEEPEKDTERTAVPGLSRLEGWFDGRKIRMAATRQLWRRGDVFPEQPQELTIDPENKLDRPGTGRQDYRDQVRNFLSESSEEVRTLLSLSAALAPYNFNVETFMTLAWHHTAMKDMRYSLARILSSGLFYVVNNDAVRQNPSKIEPELRFIDEEAWEAVCDLTSPVELRGILESWIAVQEEGKIDAKFSSLDLLKQQPGQTNASMTSDEESYRDLFIQLGIIELNDEIETEVPGKENDPRPVEEDEWKEDFFEAGGLSSEEVLQYLENTIKANHKLRDDPFSLPIRGYESFDQGKQKRLLEAVLNPITEDLLRCQVVFLDLHAATVAQAAELHVKHHMSHLDSEKNLQVQIQALSRELKEIGKSQAVLEIKGPAKEFSNRLSFSSELSSNIKTIYEQMGPPMFSNTLDDEGMSEEIDNSIFTGIELKYTKERVEENLKLCLGQLTGIYTASFERGRAYVYGVEEIGFVPTSYDARDEICFAGMLREILFEAEGSVATGLDFDLNLLRILLSKSDYAGGVVDTSRFESAGDQILARIRRYQGFTCHDLGTMDSLPPVEVLNPADWAGVSDSQAGNFPPFNNLGSGEIYLSEIPGSDVPGASHVAFSLYDFFTQIADSKKDAASIFGHSKESVFFDGIHRESHKQSELFYALECLCMTDNALGELKVDVCHSVEEKLDQLKGTDKESVSADSILDSILHHWIERYLPDISEMGNKGDYRTEFIYQKIHDVQETFLESLPIFGTPIRGMFSSIEKGLIESSLTPIDLIESTEPKEPTTPDKIIAGLRASGIYLEPKKSFKAVRSRGGYSFLRAIQIRMLAELEIITVDHSVYRNQEGQKQMTRAVEILDMITAMAKEMRMDECRKLLNGNLDSIPLELAKTLSGNFVLEHILEDHPDWLKTIRQLLEMVETYFRSDPVQVLISGLESPADMNGADQMALRMIHGDRTSDEIDDVILKYYGIYQYTKKLGLSDLHDWTP